jgi:hypothetical protein
MNFPHLRVFVNVAVASFYPQSPVPLTETYAFPTFLKNFVFEFQLLPKSIVMPSTAQMLKLGGVGSPYPDGPPPHKRPRWRIKIEFLQNEANPENGHLSRPRSTQEFALFFQKLLGHMPASTNRARRYTLNRGGLLHARPRDWVCFFNSGRGARRHYCPTANWFFQTAPASPVTAGLAERELSPLPTNGIVFSPSPTPLCTIKLSYRRRSCAALSGRIILE